MLVFWGECLLHASLVALQLVVGAHLFLPFIFYSIWRMRGKRPVILPSVLSQQETKVDYAIIITAYEQTHQLSTAIASVLQSRYKHFHVYVVIDACQERNFAYDDPRVSVLYPEQHLQSNVGSHRYAIARFVRDHNWICILDSDNLMDSCFMDATLPFIYSGYEALQGVRLPKNVNTDIACLDAARDVYYRVYDGRILFDLGSSATLTGSGMAFNTSAYIASFSGVDDIKGAGFDKVLQFLIVKSGKRIAYVEDAFVWDTKTAGGSQLVFQRARWINSWFRYSYHGISLLGTGLLKANVNQVLFSLALLRPPLFLLVLFAFVGLLFNSFINLSLSLFWAISLVFFVLGFFTALREEDANGRIYRSLKRIPLFMYLQVKALLYSRNANRRSAYTDHSVGELKNFNG
ncbi:glycosyltransferase [Olivibacter sitiensis]|uniref:glycosyltransferase n=1 Tax=Olivibacter sitiensis TaxID=376470 RepID=UPI000418F917|nr:glycosyltransferase [Olivibacter sitiensis]